MGRGNAETSWIALALLLASASVSARVSSGAKVYNVGDDAGWIVAANYSTWASRKTFHVGDTIVFIYNKTFHNVLEVSKEDYRSCNSAAPIAAHASGNDSIPITRYGHRFFICGFPGHCAGGQKLDVRVPRHLSAAAPSGAEGPSVSSPSSPAGIAFAPGSAPHGGGAAENGRGFGAAIAAAAAIVTSAVALMA